MLHPRLLAFIPFTLLAACDRGSARSPAASARTDTMVARANVKDTATMVPVSRDSADRCRWEEPAPRAHAGDEYWLAHWERSGMVRGVGLRCALREGGPEVRVVVRGYDDIPHYVDVYSPPDGRVRAQTLLLDTDEPANEHSGLMVGEDLNDDGWTDLRVQTWTGSAGISHDVFMWNPGHGRFEQDSIFPGGTNIAAVHGEPCANVSSASGAGHLTGGEYCWVRGGWHLVGSFQLDQLEGSAAMVRRFEWRNDDRVLRTVIDTVPRDVVRDIPDFRRPRSARAQPMRTRG